MKVKIKEQKQINKTISFEEWLRESKDLFVIKNKELFLDKEGNLLKEQTNEN